MNGEYYSQDLQMAQFIVITLVMCLFAAIGSYWLFKTRHYLWWALRSNLKTQRRIDQHLPQPVLVSRSLTNYSRLKSHGGLITMTWSIRLLGATLIIFAAVTIIQAVGYFF